MVELYRQCWLLQGVVQEQLEQKLAAVPQDKVLWVNQAKIQHYLGSEYHYLVYDARNEINPDILAAALGTLCAGGVLFLCMPDVEHLDPPSLFMQRMQQCLAQAGFVQTFTLEAFHQQTLPIVPSAEKNIVLNDGQNTAVAAIERVALGHAKRPLVLTADRGRGKSTALGKAWVNLQQQGKRVLLLAPSGKALDAVFKQIKSQLPDAEPQWRLPYAQLQQPEVCDLLMVDEAASIPLPILGQLLQQHNRIVFSSTVHGYEGSGRGFALRFKVLLDKYMPQWKALGLQQPVRWLADDPLEKLFNDVLLLNTELAAVVDHQKPIHYQVVSQEELLAHERRLRQMVSLLVAAHYQTRPSDLRQLLDEPNIHMQIALYDEQVVGVLLGIAEGGLSQDLAEAICRGERRPPGSMLLQSLASHVGLCEAPCLKLLRVMRIAVHPECRRQGIGRKLLQQAKHYAWQREFDLLGTSFALDDHLLPFWLDSNYQAIRIGLRQDAASGARSIQMLKPLTQAGQQLAAKSHARFQRQLPWRLAKPLNDLSAYAVGWLMRGRACGDLLLDKQDKQDLQAVANAQRSIDETLPVLWRWYCTVLAQGKQQALNEYQQTLLLGLILQNRPLLDLQKTLPIQGVAELEKQFREAIKYVMGTNV
jgi:tRNA(Met) cytidine acetyltransferase